MEYIEKYPLNNSPSGDDVKSAILKNRDEILNVAKLFGDSSSSSSSSSSSLRQRVLYGKIINGNFGFITSTNLSVSIDGSSIPILVTFAAGFNENGAVDYLERINSKVNAWTVPANKTSYLYVERKLSGLDYGSTTIKPVYQTIPPTSTLNAHYFNTLEQKMYVYNGTNWSAVTRVFIAAVTTNATAVTKTEYLNNEDEVFNVASEVSTIQTTLGTLDTKYVNAGEANSVTVSMIADGAVTDAKIGNRSISDTTASNGVDTSTLQSLLNFIGYELKRIKGSSKWSDMPSISLSGITTALEGKQPIGNYAHLDNSGKVPINELPELSTTEIWRFTE